MATSAEHYENVLSDVYSWMSGGFENGIRRNSVFFDAHNINPAGSRLAVDLGSGCGFQSIPLAMRGFTVTAIDIDRKLLKELERNTGRYKVVTINADLLEFDRYTSGRVELITCMTDTILHLDSEKTVELLFHKAYTSLEEQGKFVLTFRDLTFELRDSDRFIPVRSNDSTIFLCFLEYEMETVKVHDIVYSKANGVWEFSSSFYRKLRLSGDWVEEKLRNCGFTGIEMQTGKGLVTAIATKEKF